MTTKPDLTRIWADGAPPANIIDPDVGDPGKFDAGWVDEIPPYQYFNYLHKLFTQALKHINEFGVPVWDTDSEYAEESWTRGSDGIMYRSLQAANQGNDPTTDTTNTYWEPLLTTYSDMKTDRKNLVINGSFQVWRRSLSAAIGADDEYYAADRWIVTGTTAAGGSGTFSRQFADSGDYPNALLFGRQSRASTTAPVSYIHNVEGLYYSESKSLTLTFRVRSSMATTITSSIQAIFNVTDSLPAETETFSIDADEWTYLRQTVTFGSFAGENFFNDYAKTQIKITHNGTGTFDFDLAQVQYEFGDVPTDFEFKLLSEEEFNCLRYFQIFKTVFLFPPTTAGAYVGSNLTVPNPMRAIPDWDFTYSEDGGVSVSDVQVSPQTRNIVIRAKFDNIGTLGSPSSRLNFSEIRIDAEMRD